MPRNAPLDVLNAVTDYLDGNLRDWKITPATIVSNRIDYCGSFVIHKPNTHWFNAEIIADLHGCNIEIGIYGTKKPKTIFDLNHPDSLDAIKDHLQTLIAYTFDD